MKRKLLTLILLFASIAIFAQNQVSKNELDVSVAPQTITPDNRSTAADFTITTTDNSTFNLYNFLNASTKHYVLIELFFTS